MTLSLPIAEPEDRFAARLQADGQVLVRERVETLQLNLGKLCNLACHHCHVEAGPGRTEVMDWATMQRILAWLDRWRDEAGIAAVDLTGGAPEMNPHFRDLVQALRLRGFHVLDRCNLTILLQPGFEDMVAFLAEQQVEVVASLPCYLESNVDGQRGRGVFEGSIAALQKLNAIGYGQADPKLRLDLVYNPVDDGLPPAQAGLEAAYRQHLQLHYGVRFDRLWTLTNMPIRRFAHALQRAGKYETYMARLAEAHRTENVAHVMCRSLISVGWQGAVYDCDFNQMLAMPLEAGAVPLAGSADEHAVEAGARKLWEMRPHELRGRAIRTGSHCFGCTAGAGSSCSGQLAG